MKRRGKIDKLVFSQLSEEHGGVIMANCTVTQAKYKDY